MQSVFLQLLFNQQLQADVILHKAHEDLGTVNEMTIHTEFFFVIANIFILKSRESPSVLGARFEVAGHLSTTSKFGESRQVLFPTTQQVTCFPHCLEC